MPPFSPFDAIARSMNPKRNDQSRQANVLQKRGGQPPLETRHFGHAVDEATAHMNVLVSSHRAVQAVVLPRWKPFKDLDTRFDGLIDQVRQMAHSQGLSIEKCKAWKRDCRKEWKDLSENDRQFYFLRLQRTFALGSPIVTVPDKEGERYFTHTYRPSKLFQSRSRFAEEEIETSLATLESAAGISFRKYDKNASNFEEWRRTLHSRLSKYLADEKYSDLALYSVECELERLFEISKTRALVEHGEITSFFVIAGVMKRLSAWSLPKNIEDELRGRQRFEKVRKAGFVA